MHLKYNGFAYLPAGLKMLVPAAFVILTACSSGAPPKPAAEATETTAAVPADEPVTPVTNIDQAVAASDVSLRRDAPLVYMVKKGDTLWGIAGHFLDDPWQWPELWYTNSQIKNPHLIYPGDRLQLVWVNGHPRLTSDVLIGTNVGTRGSEMRLRPRVREEPLDQEIPAIPIDAIREFLRHPRVLTADEIDRAPYVVAFTDEHVAAGRNDGIFVKNIPPGAAENWAVVEKGDPYIDPDTNELLGYEAIPVGDAEVKVPGQPATLVLSDSTREARVGDRLLPIEKEDYNAYFYPHSMKREIGGRIISVFDGVSQIPIYQVVALNRGAKDGVDPGTVFSIMQAGRPVKDPYGSGTVQLPDQLAGLLMVFKTTPRISYAIVLRADRPAHKLDKIAMPVSRH
jgi:hypothetical protein